MAGSGQARRGRLDHLWWEEGGAKRVYTVPKRDGMRDAINAQKERGRGDAAMTPKSELAGDPKNGPARRVPMVVTSSGEGARQQKTDGRGKAAQARGSTP